MKRHAAPVLFVLAVACLPAFAQAQITRCQTTQGATLFTNGDCPAGSKVVGTVAPAPVGPTVDPDAKLRAMQAETEALRKQRQAITDLRIGNPRPGAKGDGKDPKSKEGQDSAKTDPAPTQEAADTGSGPQRRVAVSEVPYTKNQDDDSEGEARNLLGCDGAACFDTQGRAYNRDAEGKITETGANGRACKLKDGVLRCP